MSRLYLVLFLLLVANPKLLTSQIKLKDLVSFADEQYKKGDYYYALDFYQQAIAIDSNSLNLKWKYAQTLRAYKDYKAAEKAYGEIYARDDGEKYPDCILFYGLMQKQNGKYQLALETFKLAKTLFDEKESYNFKKANKEIESCYWAMKNNKDTIILAQFNQRINSFDAEFGHHYARGKLIFSSLRADSTNENEEVYGRQYTTSLYELYTSPDSLKKAVKISGLANDKTSIGNASYTPNQSYFYFSICQDDGFNYQCKIARAANKNGILGKVDTLGSIINYPNSNTTNPMITRINGKSYLFFSSNRTGTKGEMDIWYSEIIGETEFGEAINLNAVNSLDNEICPWYDTLKNQLYFSSTWHNGFGGYDVFSSKKTGDKFEKPINRNQPINSAANDLYYFEAGDSIFVSSNRAGSYSKKNPTCCSDIFFASVERPLPPPDSTSTIITKRLDFPVRLFFRNDHPSPKSMDIKTSETYEASYLDYKANFDDYRLKVNGDSSVVTNERFNKLTDFFSSSVDKGYQDLTELSDSISLYLTQNKFITFFVKGFASPLHKTKYNINLSKRRINSFYNYLLGYQNGKFKTALEQGKNKVAQIRIIEVPFGEFAANQLTSDNFNDQKNSVYSYEASIERKIEIVALDLMAERLDSLIEINPAIIHLNNRKNRAPQEVNYSLENTRLESLTIEKIECSSPELQVIEAPVAISPKSKVNIALRLDVPQDKGLYLFTFDVHFTAYVYPLRGYVTIEVQ